MSTAFTNSSDVLAGWQPGEFAAQGMRFPTFRRGSGPGVIVIHEVPGITPLVARFANELVDAGFSVVMPSLLGEPGRAPSPTYLASSMLRLCVAKEFTMLATKQSSPIIVWLRALARELHAELGGPGVGAIGMCFSGGFALGMMVDDAVAAPVVSQPSLPVPLGNKRSRALGLSAHEEAAMIAKAKAGCQVLGLRFRGDRLVGKRFTTLREELGDAFIAIELPSVKPSDHSVLTEQRDDASVERVIGFFRDKLMRA